MTMLYQKDMKVGDRKEGQKAPTALTFGRRQKVSGPGYTMRIICLCHGNCFIWLIPIHWCFMFSIRLDKMPDKFCDNPKFDSLVWYSGTFNETDDSSSLFNTNESILFISFWLADNPSSVHSALEVMLTRTSCKMNKNTYVESKVLSKYFLTPHSNQYAETKIQ